MRSNATTFVDVIGIDEKKSKNADAPNFSERSPYHQPMNPSLGGYDGTFESLTFCIGVGMKTEADHDCLLRCGGAFVWTVRTLEKLGPCRGRTCDRDLVRRVRLPVFKYHQSPRKEMENPQTGGEPRQSAGEDGGTIAAWAEIVSAGQHGPTTLGVKAKAWFCIDPCVNLIISEFFKPSRDGFFPKSCWIQGGKKCSLG